MTFARKIIEFNHHVAYTGAELPTGIRIMNPFKESKDALLISDCFYHKYYDDALPRSLILGINPGRFGAGLTGIPFTDPKRLVAECQIPYSGKSKHEPSSVFIYEVIAAFGGATEFYKAFYINSLCPLGFVKIGDTGREKNYNYYDDKKLSTTVEPFIIQNIKKQIEISGFNEVCICLGTGKNESYLRGLNSQFHFFKEIIAVEHPRFVMQYKSANKQFYIDKYLRAFDTAISRNNNLHG